MKSVRVVISKMGLDSHYRGAIVVASHLSRKGMEVIYLGNQLPPAIAQAVVEEDADVLGLSSLSGNHMIMVPQVLEELNALNAQDVVVIIGGIVPRTDQAELLRMGVARIFGPGSNLDDIADFIQAAKADRTPSTL